MSELQYPLFVYGTLMSHESAHRLLADSVDRMQPATLPDAELLSLSAYPMVVDGDDEVAGEVYWLSSTRYRELLLRLDRYEGPQYVRELRTIRIDGGYDRHEAWVYVGTERPRFATPLPHGNWRDRGKAQAP